MIEIQNKVSTNAQAMMNDLAAARSWKNVVYDTEVTTDVVQLWATDKVYLELNRATAYVYAKSTDGFSTIIGGTGSDKFTGYTMVKTDSAVYVKSNQTNAVWFAVGAMTDGTTESVGIILNDSNSYLYRWIVFTDDMTGDSLSNNLANFFMTDSVTNTQLVPIYPPYSAYHFTSIYWSFMRRASQSGKTELNGQKFYIDKYISVGYEE